MNRIHLRARVPSRRATLTAATLAATASLGLTAAASASTSQVAIIQDGNAPTEAANIPQYQALGASTVRVLLQWWQVAPRANSRLAPKFSATNPNAYPAKNWTQWDTVVKSATAAGMTVDLDIVGGPPAWAQGKGVPSKYLANHFGWEVNATDYGQFAAAVAKRYSGHFTPKGASSPLPKVSLYSIWNEPNMGQQLGPQSIDATRKSSGYSVGPLYYRNLVRSGYASLKRYAPGARILVGEFAGSGRSSVATKKFPQGLPGQTAITSPIPFVQTLYCLDSHYHRLTGQAAKVAGCTNLGSFAKQNPGLFDATAISTHPYGSHYAPDAKNVPASFVILPTINRLVTEMGRVTGAWHHSRKYAIWSTEFGYVTSPPQRSGGKPYPSPADAAIDLNESEYLSYKNPRVASYAQYLVNDPPTLKGSGLFSSGLRFANGSPKPGYNAWRLPLWVPKRTVKKGQKAEIWGGARPAVFSSSQSSVQIQMNTGSGYQTIDTLKVAKSNGYFDTHLALNQSGSMRLAYTYPASNPFLPVGDAGTTVYSRTLKINVR